MYKSCTYVHVPGAVTLVRIPLVRDLLELHDLVALAVERGPLLLVGRLARREVLLLLLLARLQPMFFLPPG